MAAIIVGGQAKNVGKTTFICNIISAFPDLKWTAAKVSNHPHVAENCEVLMKGSQWRILQQNPGADHNDTARFLKSGASRALLVQADNNSLEEACTSLMQEISATTAVIVESASAAEFLRYDLLFLLVDAGQVDFKNSAKEHLDRADALVIRDSDSRVGEPVYFSRGIPMFRAFPDHVDPALLRMLKAKLKSF